MNNVIKVTVKPSKKSDKTYPVCEFAHIFAELTKSKTLSDDTLKKVESLGFTVKVVDYSKDVTFFPEYRRDSSSSSSSSSGFKGSFDNSPKADLGARRNGIYSFWGGKSNKM